MVGGFVPFIPFLSLTVIDRGVDCTDALRTRSHSQVDCVKYCTAKLRNGMKDAVEGHKTANHPNTQYDRRKY